jgi:hypothetical protein
MIHAVTERFHTLLMCNAYNWFLLSYDCIIHVTHMILCGLIPPILRLSQEEAISSINEVIGWHRMLRHDPEWLLLEGKYIHCFLNIL